MPEFDRTARLAAHPNLADAVNRNLLRSEVEGGVSLRDLPRPTTLEIHTQNRVYRVVCRPDGDALISGHPKYCPAPVRVKICGSNWGGSMLKLGYIGRGMHLEFRHPDYDRPIVTSKIVEIREI